MVHHFPPFFLQVIWFWELKTVLQHRLQSFPKAADIQSARSDSGNLPAHTQKQQMTTISWLLPGWHQSQDASWSLRSYKKWKKCVFLELMKYSPCWWIPYWFLSFQPLSWVLSPYFKLPTYTSSWISNRHLKLKYVKTKLHSQLVLCKKQNNLSCSSISIPLINKWNHHQPTCSIQKTQKSFPFSHSHFWSSHQALSTLSLQYISNQSTSIHLHYHHLHTNHYQSILSTPRAS